jgi:hypothetical protein
MAATTDRQLDMETLAAAITAGIAALQPAKDVPLDEYLKRPGKLDPVLKRPVYQNGSEIQIKGCSTATIERLDNLKPGFYLDDLIEVRITGRGTNEKTEIIYTKGCDRDARMAIYQRVSSFSGMIKKIAAEQNGEAVAHPED